MQKIVPHLWFDREAREAAEFYTATFDGSEIRFITPIKDTPSGDAEIVGFRVMGYDFMAISAGPYFRINPSVSFHVKCKNTQETDRFWEKLARGGTVMMDIGEYPFSKRYGWIQDKFGVSWQIIHTEESFLHRITPVLMFTGENCGRAEEAVGFYSTVFRGSTPRVLARYEAGEEPDTPGTVKYSQVILDNQEFGAMDSARMHNIGFNEAVSLIVNCSDQREIDYYWEILSAVPEAEQCGWIKDKYGLSWQITPINIGELLGKNPVKTTPVMLQMKKIIIADLVRAGAEL